ncbi:MAG: hypothetical protein ACQCN5_01605 [Candidatus Bathyarchaeia archaeon]
MNRQLELDPPEHLPAPPLRRSPTATVQFFNNLPVNGHSDRPSLRLFIRDDWN